MSNKIIEVQNIKINVTNIDDNDYICISDFGKFKEGKSKADDVIRNWLRNRITLEFLGTWESIYNPNFNSVEFDGFRKSAGLHTFTLSVTEWCEKAAKSIVLIIDEVDSATNNQVFLDFLAQLRDRYIARDTDDIVTFQSVILAGVTDVKHLKSKIRDEDQHKVNSPWNIAADFDIDMSLPESGIKGMLDEYEADHHTGMDTKEFAHQIRAYTNGYPFLVSRICQLIDENVGKSMGDLSKAWTRSGLDEAIKLLLSEDNTLFQSITGKLTNYPELKAAIRSILMEGTRLTFSGQQDSIVQMQMYGLIRNDRGAVRIDNRIFETMLYNLFLSDEELNNNVFAREGELAKNRFIEDGCLNMRLILTGKKLLKLCLVKIRPCASCLKLMKLRLILNI